jgi:hypothetical protein
MTEVAKCYDCGSSLYRLKRRTYPMFTDEGTKVITKTYQCEMCNAEFLADGTPVELDKKQTISSGFSQGYRKIF